MKNLIKKENAITLIVLVITIILLLILAGITISQLTNSGLFDKAKKAKEKYEIARQEEENIVQEYANKIENFRSTADGVRDNVELLDSPAVVPTSTSAVNRDVSFSLKDSIQNYKYLLFSYSASDVNGVVSLETNTISPTSQIINNKEIVLNSAMGPHYSLACVKFVDNTTLKYTLSRSSNDSRKYFAIVSIIGMN